MEGIEFCYVLFPPMKNSISTLILVLLCGLASAQDYSDLSVDTIIEPKELQTYTSSSGGLRFYWPIHAVIKNNGSDTLHKADTFGWSASLYNKATSSAIVLFPAAGHIPFALNKDLAPGDTACQCAEGADHVVAGKEL